MGGSERGEGIRLSVSTLVNHANTKAPKHTICTLLVVTLVCMHYQSLRVARRQRLPHDEYVTFDFTVRKDIKIKSAFRKLKQVKRMQSVHLV